MRRVAMREVVTLLRDGRFRLAALLMMAVLALAASSGWRAAHENQVLRERTMHEFREEWKGQTEKNPHSAGHFGTYVLKPIAGLSGLDPGIDPYTGRLLFLEAHVRNNFIHRPAVELTPLRQLGFFTASFVLQAAAPLLIVLFGYAAFAGERESGTLRQILATGVSVRQLVGGKVIGTLAGLMLLLAPAAAVGAVALVWSQGALEVDRVGLLVTGYVLYFLAFSGVVLAVSALAKRSQVALVVLLAFWAVGIFVVPRIAADLASSRDPLPTRASLDDEVRRLSLEGIDGHDPMDKRRDALLEQVLKEYAAKSVEEMPVNFDAIAMQASEDYTTQVYAEKFREVEGVLQRHQNMIGRAALFSPYLAVRDWSMASVGTDLRHHLAFEAAAEAYRTEFNRQLNEHNKVNSKTGDYGFYVDQGFWESVPPFRYESPSSGWSVAGARSSLVMLAAWAFGALAFAALAAARIRP